MPCFTVRSTQSQWQLFRNGPTDIRKSGVYSVIDFRRDGSHVTVEEAGFGHLFSSAEVKRKSASMYLAPERQIVVVDHTARTIGRREPLIWHDLPFRRSKDSDSDCRTGILHAGTDFRLQERTVVAGVPVVKWYRTLGNGGSEEIYLAPSLDCMALKTYRMQRNAWRLPVFVDRWEVNSVELGEPAADLFALPVGYREIEHPGRAGMLRYLESNGSRVAKPAP